MVIKCQFVEHYRGGMRLSVCPCGLLPAGLESLPFVCLPACEKFGNARSIRATANASTE
jgi:hypothetical protein